VGSSKNSWERAGKLLASALKMVQEGSRSLDEWIELLQLFVFKPRFVCEVNSDDPRWQSIEGSNQTKSRNPTTIEDFPIKGKGKKKVIFELVPVSTEITPREVLKIFKRRHLSCPDRAQAETFVREYPEEHKEESVIALCGSVRDDFIALLDADPFGKVNLMRWWLDVKLPGENKFLAVREEVLDC